MSWETVEQFVIFQISGGRKRHSEPGIPGPQGEEEEEVMEIVLSSQHDVLTSVGQETLDPHCV